MNQTRTKHPTARLCNKGFSSSYRVHSFLKYTMHIYAVIVSFFMTRWHFRVSTFHAVPAGGRGPMRATTFTGHKSSGSIVYLYTTRPSTLEKYKFLTQTKNCTCVLVCSAHQQTARGQYLLSQLTATHWQFSCKHICI
jgi:hypothetical protein